MEKAKWKPIKKQRITLEENWKGITLLYYSDSPFPKTGIGVGIKRRLVKRGN